MLTAALLTTLRDALAGHDLPPELDERAEAVIMIILAARDILQFRRLRDIASAHGDARAVRQHGAELAAAETELELHLRTLTPAQPPDRTRRSETAA